jgi:hypothetical protein
MVGCWRRGRLPRGELVEGQVDVQVERGVQLERHAVDTEPAQRLQLAVTPAHRDRLNQP